MANRIAKASCRDGRSKTEKDCIEIFDEVGSEKRQSHQGSFAKKTYFHASRQFNLSET